MQTFKKILNFLAASLQFFVRHMPVSVTALVGLYFTVGSFINSDRNTIDLTNYAFAVVAALSSISFAYSRSVENEEDRRMAQYCGERFLHSAILFLMASILKYFLLEDQIQKFHHTSGVLAAMVSFVGIFPSFLFLASWLNVIAGIREINTILYSKKKPGEELARFL